MWGPNPLVLGEKLHVGGSLAVPRVNAGVGMFFAVLHGSCSVTQSYLALCDPVDCSLPGSSVPTPRDFSGKWAVCHVAVVYFNCKPCRGNRHVGPHVPSAILRLTGELGFCPFSQRWCRRICPVSSDAPCNSGTLRQELTHVSPLIASSRPGFLPSSSDAQGRRCR